MTARFPSAPAAAPALPRLSPCAACRHATRPGSASRGGFTLIEMLTALSVLAVTLAIAAPSLGAFIRSSRIRSAQSELVASLMLARSEAARRGVPVTLRARDTAEAGGLARGWRVWADLNGNGVVDGGESVLREVADLGMAVVVTPASTLAVTYSPRGFLEPLAAVNLIVCGRAGDRGYPVSIQPAGLADLKPPVECS